MFVIDDRVEEHVLKLLPKGIEQHFVSGLPDQVPEFGGIVGQVTCAICRQDANAVLDQALSIAGQANTKILCVDPAEPMEVLPQLTKLLLDRLHAAHLQSAEARAAIAQMRSEGIVLGGRMREVETLLYALGNPQFINDLTWEPTGQQFKLAHGEELRQALPINAVGILAVDLWFPGDVVPLLEHLSLWIEDNAGEHYALSPVTPDMGAETGWLRFQRDKPILGVWRDCHLVLRWKGPEPLDIGLAQAVPDMRFRPAVKNEQAVEQTLALRIWKSLGGIRLPACTPILADGKRHDVSRACFVRASAMPPPSLFFSPPQATDHVSTAFWPKENAILVHPTRVGTVCTILRNVDLSGLIHISALVTVGHARSPNLNFAIGVAPSGAVDADGLWQRRLGPWVTGLPAHGWAQAHCLPQEKIEGQADVLLAVSLASDQPNDMSWGLFCGFRINQDPTVSTQPIPQDMVIA